MFGPRAPFSATTLPFWRQIDEITFVAAYSRLATARVGRLDCVARCSG
jgi:hypothetical protein